MAVHLKSNGLQQSWPHRQPDGTYRWDDGSTPTIDEMRQAFDMAAKSSPGTGTTPEAQQEREDLTALKFDHAQNVIEDAGGAADPGLPQVVTPNSPGGSLDTTQSDQDAAGTAQLLKDLQQQAATGGGAWEQSLKNATQKASAGASALGQEQQQQTGGNYGAALRNIGNAQAGAEQRAVGQGNILRAKSQQSAQQGLEGLTAGMQGNAANQAATQAAIKRQIADTNSALISDSQKADEGRGNAMSMGMSKMSDGGEVPGQPKVFGDDSSNDTVPAKLSPGEIVLPRSVVSGPDAPAKAAAFVKALQAKEQGAHAGGFADGGTTGDQAFGPYKSGQAPSGNDTGLHGTTADDFGGGNYVGHWFMPHAFDAPGYQRLREKYVQSGRPSTENGGLLQTDPYNTARSAAMQNNASLLKSAEGGGPTVAPQMMQNTSDNNTEAAMQAQAAGKGGADLVGRTTAEQQNAAGQTAGVSAQEQQVGQAGASRAFNEQQARDLAFSKAQQEAAWSNTMINAGLGLDQQNQMRNLFAGAGQAATSLSGLGGSNSNKPGSKDPEGFTFKEGDTSGASGPNQYNETPQDYTDNTMESEYAHGGMVKKDKRGEEFVKALSRGGYC